MGTRSLFLIGMTTCLLSAALIVAGVVGIAWGTAIGMVGIGILGSSAVPRTGG
ncbi:MAG: hypothetical protein HKN03_10190 [Acidimicrobiales bacterium]|nr:hypothetical protein [Acidimicrobiales bacterium]